MSLLGIIGGTAAYLAVGTVARAACAYKLGCMRKQYEEYCDTHVGGAIYREDEIQSGPIENLEHRDQFFVARKLDCKIYNWREAASGWMQTCWPFFALVVVGEAIIHVIWTGTAFIEKQVGKQTSIFKKLENIGREKGC